MWIYLRLLALYPPDFRRAFAPEMVEVFRQRCLRARATRGRLGLGLLLVREVPNLLANVVSQRFGAGPDGLVQEPAEQPERKGDTVFENLLRDLRFAFRSLGRTPGFTAIVVGTLALGIGANVAIFSVVKVVLLTPPPYESPEQLVMVWEQNLPRNSERNVVNPQNFTAWRDRNDVFEEMVAWSPRSVNMTGDGDPQRVRLALITTELFSLLRVSPMMGRVFAPEEIEPGNHRVVVLGHGFWQRQYGGVPAVIGTSITLNDLSHEIVGIMAEGFDFPERTDMWAPFALGNAWRTAGGRFHMAIGRLRDGVTIERAQAEMSAIGQVLSEERPDFNTGWGVNLVPLQEQIAGGIRPALLVMLGAVVFVLLIACANVANLLLGRAAGRGKEIAIRSALGAGRGRLIRQLLTESAVLTAASLLLGVGLAYSAVTALINFGPSDIPRLGQVRIDLPVLAFSLGIGGLTALTFGLVPAVTASKTDMQSSLKEGGRMLGATGHHRLRSALVVTEISMAFVLLVGAGLLIRSFQRLLEVDLGFEERNVLSASVQLPGARYPTGTSQVAFFNEVTDRLAEIPQVETASAISYLPLGGQGSATSFTADDRPTPPDGQWPVADVRAVHHDYFATMRIPILQGRGFDGREREDADMFPIVITEAMANALWPDQSPIGKTLSMPWGSVMHGEVIGVAADVRHMGLESTPRSMIYWSHNQFPNSFMTFVLRTTIDPLDVTVALREQVWAVDANLPISNIRTMEDRLGSSNAQRRFNMTLLGVFAGVAVILACVGIYGVMSFAVAQRTHELGLRMALGARPADVLRMVIGSGMTLALIAVVTGLAVAFGVTRAMTSLLFQVSALDPVTFIGVAVLLSAIAMAACWVPARRATKVDPIVALRNE
jgi:putative ABC transport system permease protein